MNNSNNLKNMSKKLEQNKQYKTENYVHFKRSEKYEQKLDQNNIYQAENYKQFKPSEKYE